jgi:uncharacterized repeat protein (TIGR02543 family)
MVSLAMLGISGCDVFLGPDTPVGKGTLSIGFGEDGGSARSVSAETLTTLRYELVLTGPDRQKITASLVIGQTFNEQVALGEWRIEAEAFTPDGILFGTGSNTITVRAGANQVRVPMTEVSLEGALPVSALDLTALVTAPARDTMTNTMEIDVAQYTGNIAWQNADGADFSGNFAPSTIYQATINLTAKTGYTFAGVGADSFSHDGAETVTNVAGSGNTLTVTIVFPATAAAGEETVSDLDLTALVIAPERDATPNTTPINESQYTGTIAWQNADGTSLSGNFAPSTAYTAVVSLTATTGYTFSGLSANRFIYTYTGTEATNPAGSGNTLTVTISFPETAPPGENTVSAFDLTTLVTAPVKGATPTTEINEPQYAGTITWDPADATFGASTAYQAKVSLTVKTGYTFAGLSANSFYHTYTGAAATNPEGSGNTLIVTISFPETAALTQNTITFDSHGGSAVSSITANTGTTTPKPTTDPTRTGYGFQGWFDGEIGGAEYAWPHPLTADITMHAQWTAISYTVAYNANSGIGTMPPSSHTYDVAKNLSANAFTRTGYNFGGWNTAADGSGTAHAGGASVLNWSSVNGDTVTLYAQWTRTTIILNPDTGDGAFNQESFTISKGGGTGSQTVAITGSGYANPRWFVDGDLKGTGNDITINAADYSLGSHNLTLLINKSGVSWSKELPFTVEAGTLRTVIFRTNNDTGAIYAVRTTTAGSALGGGFPPVDPVRDGYDFSEWNTQDTGSGSSFEATTPVSGDTTVYARWDPHTYTVTFMHNDSLGDTTPAGPQATVIVPAKTVASADFPTPTRTSYNLAGWNTQPNGSSTAFGETTEVHGNTTVYAQWAHEDFNITLNSDAGNPAFTQGTFTVSKGGGNGSQTVNITGSGYTNPRWFVDGDLKGTGTSIAINASDYSLGTHNLTLLISKSGVSWSKELPFTVDAGTLRTVIFRSNDDTGTIYAVRTVTAGNALDGSFPGDPARDEYTFSGWDTLDTGGGSALTNTTTVSADTTVYAQWTGNTYTVTFMQNDSLGDTAPAGPQATVIVPAKTVTATDFPNPTRTDYNFAGWNTQRDGSGAAFGLTTEVHGDITVYAQWAHENFNITLNADAGSGAFSESNFTVSKGGGGSQTVAITGSGYTNPRWFVDGDLRGTGTSITINAADYPTGGHNLTLLISKNGVSWSKEIVFTVTN